MRRLPPAIEGALRCYLTAPIGTTLCSSERRAEHGATFGTP